MANSQVTPYKDPNLSKKEQVAKMFDNISHRYDFLNHFLSMGIDKLWRKKAIKILAKDKPQSILDIATGTGDFAFEAFNGIKPQKLVGVDISEGMLSKARIKAKDRNLDAYVSFNYGDSENLQFEDNSFDAAIVAFGVRNFENLDKGLSEIFRVLKPGGRIVVLEFSKPKTFPVKQVYNFYFKYILPFWGKLISKDAAAYTYLPESVQVFPEGKDFVTRLNTAGFVESKDQPLTFGICSLYTGKK